MPAVLAVYYLFLPRSRKAQNVFLALASLFFYAWGEPKFVLVMLASIVMNWWFGLLAGNAGSEGRKRLVAGGAVAFNLAVLFVFKYLNFVVDNLHSLFGISFAVGKIALPIGISFFTFQAMSYVLDVCRGDGRAQKSVVNVGLYISFFPQLIAGPIVRYNTVAEQIENRKVTPERFFGGFSRFVVGLAKKVLLANSIAAIADRTFDGFAAGAGMSTLGGWLGAVCYAMQIFYDFSGYSDMAIGLGAMFGFQFLENFDHPYASTSITEFWRRWHISLGTWFRDYVYIPLGGSRVSKPRLVANLFVVWLLTGAWHGANWTFLAWGFMYFVLLAAEKLLGFHRTERKAAKPFLWLYTSLFVLLGWVLFRSSSIADAGRYIAVMFGKGGVLADARFFAEWRQAAVWLAFCAFFCFPVLPKPKEGRQTGFWPGAFATAGLVALFALSVASIVSNSYNPFIYFNF